MMQFRDRADAGERLAQVLRAFKGKDTVVLALPRGGVVLGAIVAEKLRAPLGTVLVRKISHPYSPEYAIGAVVDDREPVLNRDEALTVSETWLQNNIEEAQALNRRRAATYLQDKFQVPAINGKIVIIIDDGMATGLTMQAAAFAVRAERPKRIIVAVPVASLESVGVLEPLVDDLVILENPEEFMGAIGLHY